MIDFFRVLMLKYFSFLIKSNGKSMQFNIRNIQHVEGALEILQKELERRKELESQQGKDSPSTQVVGDLESKVKECMRRIAILENPDVHSDLTTDDSARLSHLESKMVILEMKLARSEKAQQSITEWTRNLFKVAGSRLERLEESSNPMHSPKSNKKDSGSKAWR